MSSASAEMTVVLPVPVAVGGGKEKRQEVRQQERERERERCSNKSFHRRCHPLTWWALDELQLVQVVRVQSPALV